jgi:hypothetical protein
MLQYVNDMCHHFDHFKQSNRYILRVITEAFMFVLAAVGGKLAAIEHLRVRQCWRQFGAG